MVDVLVIIVGCAASFLAGVAVTTARQRERRLIEGRSGAPGARLTLPELASSFRDFVEAVEGAVSPEVEAACEALERAPAKKKDRPTLTYASGKGTFWIEWDCLADKKASAAQSIDVVRDYLKRYRFDETMRAKVLSCINEENSRNVVRKLFAADDEA